MAEENEPKDSLTEEQRKYYEQACKESVFVRQIRSKLDMNDQKAVLKLYNKTIKDNLFSTVVGCAFLEELKEQIVKDGQVSEDALLPIPVLVRQEEETEEKKEKERYSYRRADEEIRKYKKKVEGQQITNKKLKIALAAAVLLLVGFVVINLRFEYSIFTYFTDYKTNMEEELVDKYEQWEANLQEREQKLEQGEGAGQDG